MTSTLAPERRASSHGLAGVDRLARLADPDDQGVRVEHRVAVAELAGDVDLDGQPGPVLDGVLGHQAGVVAAAAGHDEDLVDRPELVVGDVDLVEGQGAVGEQPVEQGVGHRLGLLVHLLAHEVVVAVLAGGIEVPVHVSRLGSTSAAVDGSVTRIDPGRSSATWSSSRTKKSRVRPEDGRDVRGQEGGSPSLTPISSGETRRAATIRSGSAACDHGQGEGAPDPAEGRAARHRPGRRGVAAARPDSIRWARTSVSVSDSRRWPAATSSSASSTWFSMIPLWTRASWPDAVEVGVGVVLGGTAVGGPPGVADAGRRTGRGGLGPLGQVVERPGAVGRPGPPQAVGGVRADQGDAGRVVAAVLEAGQPLEQDSEHVGGVDGAGAGPVVIPMMPHMGYRGYAVGGRARPHRAGWPLAGGRPPTPVAPAGRSAVRGRGGLELESHQRAQPFGDGLGHAVAGWPRPSPGPAARSRSAAAATRPPSPRRASSSATADHTASAPSSSSVLGTGTLTSTWGTRVDQPVQQLGQRLARSGPPGRPGPAR